jgi:hypothetical protein
MARRPGRLRKISQHEYQQKNNDAGENDGANEIRPLQERSSKPLSCEPLPDLVDDCSPCDRLVGKRGSYQQRECGSSKYLKDRHWEPLSLLSTQPIRHATEDDGAGPEPMWNPTQTL